MHPQSMVESGVYLEGVWEPHIIDTISGYLQNSSDIVIDVGANIGATSIPLAKHFPDAQFYLYEPHPTVFSDLENNISYNKLTNIYAYNVAITNSVNGSLPFYAQKNTHNFGLSSFKLNHDIDDHEVIQVNCLSLDSQFLSTDRTIKIIKIDTQGHELEVLLSAEKIIARDRPVILFEFESEYFESQSEEIKTKEELIKFFMELNYEIYMNNAQYKFLPALTLKLYFHGDIIAVPLALKNKLSSQ
jgi:FkbM family methyltransferase